MFCSIILCFLLHKELFIILFNNNNIELQILQIGAGLMNQEEKKQIKYV